MEFSPTIIDRIQELHALAKTDVQRLKLEAEAAAEWEKMWANCLDYLRKGWAIHFQFLVESEAARFKTMRMERHPAVDSIDEAYRAAKDESVRVLRRFPELLERACQAADLKLDSDSRHPNYGLERGFFKLEIDEPKRRARLSDREGLRLELSADVPAIVELIKREHKRVFGRPFNGSKVLKALRSQYKAIIKKEKKADGESVSIRQITKGLGKSAKNFRTDEFLVNLSRLTEKGPLDIDGRRLDLQHTKDTKDGMLLHGALGRGYVGFVVFREV